MSNNNSDYSWAGWIIAAIFAVIIFWPNTPSDSANTSAPIGSNPSIDLVGPTVEATADDQSKDDSAWHCIDATSYNQNAYDDNKCTKGSETRYVSDSQAIDLDPSYSPGKSGATYYNNQ